jgi:predicted nucleotidyltransferase
MPLAPLVADRREEILHLAEKHGARNVRVSGSAARGELAPDSDVDFLVDLDTGRSLFDLGGLLIDLQNLLGREVDAATEQGIHWYIRERVNKEAERL